MSALDVFKAVSAEIALSIPTVVVGSLEREHLELVSLANRAGEEIARRAYFSGLRQEKTITLDGSTSTFSLDGDYLKRMDGASVKINGAPVRGGLSDDEWKALPTATGAARFFHLKSTTISFWPTPPAGTAKFDYYSKKWALQGGAYFDYLTADSNTILFPEILLTTGIIVRWRRLKGLEFSDQLAEFESMLADYADFDGGPRSP
jgi:hypothetical protein